MLRSSDPHFACRRFEKLDGDEATIQLEKVEREEIAREKEREELRRFEAAVGELVSEE